MKCPVCSESALVMTARQGIEIDYCPQCVTGGIEARKYGGVV